ncbi:hypothetical protein K435DRAFT_962715 [Dendrothele bispora CBS 962.96]|uniref:Uncharacterized protein n=1 Tax=Dendrothele bispora (strain CBS 962.96) TaxID=1314807 RepID=A0A4S8MJW1_DENBC|nr:hypothetical protein K435DRAFT_962715 [Dendrothele bispora CBS 962.96]
MTVTWSFEFCKPYLIIFLVLLLLFGPWVFYIEIKRKGGLYAFESLARLMVDHPHTVTFTATLVSDLIAIAMLYCFGVAVSYASKCETSKKTKMSVMSLSFYWALAAQNKPWPFPDVRKNSVAGRLLIIIPILIIIYGLSPTLVSGINSIVTPVDIGVSGQLRVSELDFFSNSPDCVQWFNDRSAENFTNSCKWNRTRGVWYTTCLAENQRMDVVEAGRSRLNFDSSGMNTSQNIASFAQLHGLRFQGPIRGVIPKGPNGMPGPLEDSLQTGSFEGFPTGYSYTLEAQGIQTSVECFLDQNSRFNVTNSFNSDDGYGWQIVAGTCPEGQSSVLYERFQNVLPIIPNSNAVAYWACNGTAADDPGTFYIYLQGNGPVYGNAVRSIFCRVTSLQPSVFVLNYTSSGNYFTLSDHSTASSTISSPQFNNILQAAFTALGDVFVQTQSGVSSDIVESVLTAGIVTQNTSTVTVNLQLYSDMIEGMIEYEASYLRLLYSLQEDVPSSCQRTRTGSITYTTKGWQADQSAFAFLLVPTVLNIVSFATLIMFITRRTRSEKMDDAFDPTEFLSLVLAEPTDPGKDGWDSRIQVDKRRNSQASSAV